MNSIIYIFKMLKFSAFCLFFKNFTFKNIKSFYSEYMDFCKKKKIISSICTIIYTNGEFNFIKDIKWFWKIFPISQTWG